MEVMVLKVNVVCSKEKQKKIEEKLKQAGFTIALDGDFVFKEVDYKQESFIGFSDDAFTIVSYKEVLYVEAFDHDVFLKTLEKTFKIKEKLYQVELILEDHGFVRINKSQIVNIKGIKSMIPSLNSRMNLIMKNKEMLYVSRVYLSNFKESIGFK